MDGLLNLEMADGDSIEFDLVAIAWSVAKDDIVLQAVLTAQPAQPPIGGAKVFNLPPLYSTTTSPDPESTGARSEQGQINDCWFVAAAITLAKNRPGDIKAMIKDNGDTTFTVTFPGAKKQVVTVKGKDLDLVKLAKSDGIWLAVLEEAYARLKNDGRTSVIKQFFGKDKEIDFMGFSKNTIRTLTGHGADSDLLKQFGGLMTNARIKKIGEKLNAALNPPVGTDKRMVTVLTRPTLKGFYDMATDKLPINDNGLVSTHWYAVYEYDATPGQERVLVRNPWGQKGEFGQIIDKKTGIVTATPDGIDNGLFWMTLNEFANSFALVTYEESR